MSSLTANILDMNADSVHDDVDLILNCSGPDIIELIASDPSYYLNIVSNYNKTRDGRDIYLQDLCNILITKNSSEYRIKFKLTDNGQWYEVGYCGDSFTEEDVHDAFCKKVTYALSRPANAHRAMINNSLLDNGSPSTSAEDEVAPPGSVMSYSKIDKFMNRLPKIQPQPVKVNAEVKVNKATEPPVSVPVVPAQDSAESDRRQQVLNDAFQDLIKQRAIPLPPTGSTEADSNIVIPTEPRPVPTAVIGNNESSNVNNLTLELLAVICPAERKEAYLKLVELLTSQDPFILGLIELLPKLNAGQRMLVISFLN